ncbi:MAG: hypothetical protein DBY04_03040 [Clostridiales bacterium]|nr:MAG: hypothetical protein DBY04_03040 [Clostridiales bacterium]
MIYKVLLHDKSGTYPLFDIKEPFPDEAVWEQCCQKIRVTAVFSARGDAVLVTLTAAAEGSAACYFSLYGSGDGTLYSFNGPCKHEQLLRQSPHDYRNYQFKMDSSAVPMAAVVREGKTNLFISDHPGHCDNYTTQHFLPETGEFFLSSGDPGGSPNFEGDHFPPYFHEIGGGKTHTFRFIIKSCEAASLKAIRREAFLAIDNVWGDSCGRAYHAVSFASNYMHYRRNESGTSDYWIVAGIQYANCQYVRDSFYQTWILPVDMEMQCYLAFREDWLKQAENSLIYLIWSYRIVKKGGSFNRELARKAYDIMMACLSKHTDGGYYPNCDEHGAFRNWFDICCFEFDDLDSYSQGLCVCALRAAKELGFEIYDTYKKAINRYLSLYNGEYIPMSEKKPYLALDFAVGDLFHFILFGHTFLPDEMVRKTYRRIMESKAKTPYGTKIVSAPDGEYLPMEAYGAYGYIHPEMAKMDLGRYANGGSYHIYEMLFHIDAYLHGAPDAVDNMIWRLFIDLDYDGATHEYMHTLQGNGVKANQGWNAAVYEIWDELCRNGKGDPRFFEAAENKLLQV